MADSRPSSGVKRARIIAAARALFIEHGYDGTTVQIIAQRSDAALGSVTYLAGSKPVIATEIYDALVLDLVTIVRRSVAAGALANSAPRIITACHNWLEEDPTRLRLLDDLDQALLRDRVVGHRSLGARLAAALDAFGRTAAAQTGGLNGSELYALFLAPVLEDMRLRQGAVDRSRRDRQRWVACLTAAAVAGLEKAAGFRPSNQPEKNDDLFRRGV